jgi:polysaccharide chain length determinant protein (PEP-CTERM system associated)
MPDHRRPARQTGEAVSLHALLAMLRRRKLHFLIAVPLVAAAFGAAAYLLPERYYAEALVTSEPTIDPRIGDVPPPELHAERQLARITDVLHRRSLLEGVIREFDLYPETRGRVSAEQIEATWSRVSLRVEGDRSFSIGFEDGDRQRVAAVAARLAELLIGTTGAEDDQRAAARTNVLDSELPAVEARMEELEQGVERYKQQWFAEIPEQAQTNLKLLEGIQTRLQDVSAAITDDEARRSGITSELAELDRQGVTLQPPKSAARTRIEQLETELRGLERRYTDRHPEVVRARAELEELRQAEARGEGGQTAVPEYSPVQLRYLELQADLQAVEQRLVRSRAEQAALSARSADFQRRVEAAPRHEAALAAMNREVDATRARYDELTAKQQEARLAERFEKSEQGGAAFRLLEPPRVPAEPVSPDRLRILILGIGVGLITGLGSALLAEQMDTSYRDVESFEADTELPVLATVPSLPAAGGRGAGTLGRRVALLDEPHGMAAEQYRILAIKLTRHAGRPRPTSVLVTSPVGEEGKSTTAVNLAVALTRMVDEPVLLVDGDLRRPSIHRLLRLPPGSGLGALLASPDDDPARYVRRHHGLSILEAGRLSPRTRSALASPLAQRVFQRLRQRYSYIVVDAPPVLAAAEGLILQQMVDSVLLVVRARSTPRRAVHRAIESLDLSRLVGVALNDVEAASAYPSAYHYFEPVDEPVATAPAVAEGGKAS